MAERMRFQNQVLNSEDYEKTEKAAKTLKNIVKILGAVGGIGGICLIKFGRFPLKSRSKSPKI